VRFPHQCLIAEIAFDPVAIPVGKDPGNWDKLAQRNLAWSDLGSAEALCSFEIKPTRAGQPLGAPPDELMIDWRRTPVEGTAQVYLPALDADEVLKLAGRMYATHSLTRADGHTLACRTRGITYIPIPPGGSVDHAGLLSVQLPDPLRRGERFDVVDRRDRHHGARRKREPRRDSLAARARRLPARDPGQRQSRPARARRAAAVGHALDRPSNPGPQPLVSRLYPLPRQARRPRLELRR
jgi:hypothetical protein